MSKKQELKIEFDEMETNTLLTNRQRKKTTKTNDKKKEAKKTEQDEKKKRHKTKLNHTERQDKNTGRAGEAL